jgi:hypothetical protein
VKIRLWGLPEENDQVAAALRAAFTVVDESDDYLPRRGDSPLRRRYIEIRIQAPPGNDGA